MAFCCYKNQYTRWNHKWHFHNFKDSKNIFTLSYISYFRPYFFFNKLSYCLIAIKVLCAEYIVYLNLKKIINEHKFNNQRIDSKNTKKINLFNAYKEGFTTMILNPKAILFYINILSQFINHQNNESVQGAILSGLFIVTVITWFS